MSNFGFCVDDFHDDCYDFRYSLCLLFLYHSVSRELGCNIRYVSRNEILAGDAADARKRNRRVEI